MLIGTGEPTAPEVDALVHFQRLLELLPAGAYTCRPDGRLTYFSRQAATLWGYEPDLNDPDAPRYCGSLRLFTEDGMPLARERCWMARALDERQQFHGHRVQIERPDGDRRVALAYASPLLDGSGRLLGGLNLLVDITEQHRRTQAEAERLRARGEQLVSLACDIRAGLAPIRHTARRLAMRPDAPVAVAPEQLDHQLRHITWLVDRVLNLEVD